MKYHRYAPKSRPSHDGMPPKSKPSLSDSYPDSEKNLGPYRDNSFAVLCDRRLPGLDEIIRKEEEKDKGHKGRTFDQLVARAHETWIEDAREEKNQQRKKRSGV